MKLLALDTSSLACSVALSNDGAISERHEERPREHTRILVPMIRAVLAEVRLEAQSLDAIVLGNGPGSFIGMRIAASVAQGMAYGGGVGIVPVSSLAAVAQQVFEEQDTDQVVVAQDAHMDQVYLGIYRRGADGLATPLGDERIAEQAPVPELDAAGAARRIAAGYGWQRYPELQAANRDRFAAVANVRHPRARYVLELGRAAFEQSGALEAKAIEPAYLRQKVAEKPAS